MTTNDPFTRCARAISAALLGAPGFAALVRGRVVDMTSPQFERFSTDVQPGDLPEVAVVQGAFAMVPFGSNSRVADISQHFDLRMTFDSLWSVPMNAVKYQAFIALLRSGPTLGLDGLVRGWQIVGGRDSPDGQTNWTRGAVRWISILGIQVEMALNAVQLAI